MWHSLRRLRHQALPGRSRRLQMFSSINLPHRDRAHIRSMPPSVMRLTPLPGSSSSSTTVLHFLQPSSPILLLPPITISTRKGTSSVPAIGCTSTPRSSMSSRPRLWSSTSGMVSTTRMCLRFRSKMRCRSKRSSCQGCEAFYDRIESDGSFSRSGTSWRRCRFPFKARCTRFRSFASSEESRGHASGKCILMGQYRSTMYRFGYDAQLWFLAAESGECKSIWHCPGSFNQHRHTLDSSTIHFGLCDRSGGSGSSERRCIGGTIQRPPSCKRPGPSYQGVGSLSW